MTIYAKGHFVHKMLSSLLSIPSYSAFRQSGQNVTQRGALSLLASDYASVSDYKCKCKFAIVENSLAHSRHAFIQKQN